MNWKQALPQRFTVDPRSLLVFRWGLGAIVLVDLVQRASLSRVLLSPGGLLKTHPEEYLGLLRLFDFDGAHWLLFAGAAVSAVLVALQVAPKCSGAALWLSMASIGARNPWSLDGGDWCLRWLLFWNLLISLEGDGAPIRSSKQQGASRASLGVEGFSFARAGLLLQPLIIYLTSVVHKVKGNTWREGTAVQAALSQSLWERPFGTWIVESEPLAVVVNYLTLAIELLAPLLLISPYRPRASRWLGIGLLTVLQLGIALSLRMNLFPLIMTVALVPFVPGSIWPQMSVFSERSAAGRGLPFAWRLSQFFLLQALIAAADSLAAGRLLPSRVAHVQAVLGFDQSWSMYSPNPYRYDFGIEVCAKTTNGKMLVLDPGRRQHPFPPLNLLWADYRAGMYLENLSSPNWFEELTGLAEWIASEHEREHSERLEEISVTMFEWTRGRPEEASATPLLVWRRGASKDAAPTSQN